MFDNTQLFLIISTSARANVGNLLLHVTRLVQLIAEEISVTVSWDESQSDLLNRFRSANEGPTTSRRTIIYYAGTIGKDSNQECMWIDVQGHQLSIDRLLNLLGHSEAGRVVVAIDASSESEITSQIHGLENEHYFIARSDVHSRDLQAFDGCAVCRLLMNSIHTRYRVVDLYEQFMNHFSVLDSNVQYHLGEHARDLLWPGLRPRPYELIVTPHDDDFSQVRVEWSANTPAESSPIFSIVLGTVDYAAPEFAPKPLWGYNIEPRIADPFEATYYSVLGHTRGMFIESADVDINKPKLFEVWFGTNRATIKTKPYFGTKRGTDVHYGKCYVSIPKAHVTGSLGSAWWKRWLTWTDDRLKLVQTVIQEEDRFWSEAAQCLHSLRSGDRIALIYLHGFNVSFAEAAIRAAQIGFDLQLAGLMSFFSWPSKGRPTGYLADTATISASEDAITRFIKDFINCVEVEKVHILAHSMGNQALVRSIERIVSDLPSGYKERLGQIILAAPDVDCEAFRNLAIAYKTSANRTTMYVSARDRALQSSGIVNDYPRAGFLPPVTVVPGVDTIEVTDIDLTLLGHSHYAELRDLMHDMHALIKRNAHPSERYGLVEAKNEDGNTYWRLRR